MFLDDVGEHSSSCVIYSSFKRDEWFFVKNLETPWVGIVIWEGKKEQNDEAGLDVQVTESGSGQLNGGRKI